MTVERARWKWVAACAPWVVACSESPSAYPVPEPPDAASAGTTSTGGVAGKAGSANIPTKPVPTDERPAVQAPTPPPVVTVQMIIASIPDHADVLVDGKFRGTTPLALNLPSVPVEIRIERQGRIPWTRTLTPEVGMQLAPALEEIASAPAIVPVPAPIPAPAPVVTP